MKLTHLLTACILVLSAVKAQAGIMYAWQGVNKQSPSVFSLRLEFDEATVAKGAFSLHIEPGDTAIRTDSGLLGFYLPYSAYRPAMDPFNGGMGFGYLHMDVRFIEGKFLTGSIRYADWQTELHMASGPLDRLFTIQRANADYGMGDCAGPTGIVCSGGTGHIRAVPEPALPALLGLGGFAALVARRRRRSA